MTKKTTSTEDAALFRNAVGTVRTIESDAVVHETSKPAPYPVAKPPEFVNPLQNTVDEGLETLFQEDKMAFIVVGLQKNVLKKLRRGQYGVDADIDLHGLIRRDAQQHLLRFLHDCVENGCRCVQIVHGKGYNSPGQQPVLKNDLNLWLRQHKDVLAFCSAPPRAGGAGALYVLLRASDKFAAADDEQDL